MPILLLKTKQYQEFNKKKKENIKKVRLTRTA